MADTTQYSFVAPKIYLQCPNNHLNYKYTSCKRYIAAYCECCEGFRLDCAKQLHIVMYKLTSANTLSWYHNKWLVDLALGLWMMEPTDLTMQMHNTYIMKYIALALAGMCRKLSVQYYIGYRMGPSVLTVVDYYSVYICKCILYAHICIIHKLLIIIIIERGNIVYQMHWYCERACMRSSVCAVVQLCTMHINCKRRQLINNRWNNCIFGCTHCKHISPDRSSCAAGIQATDTYGVCGCA